jgi:hypothetical protein
MKLAWMSIRRTAGRSRSCTNNYHPHINEEKKDEDPNPFDHSLLFQPIRDGESSSFSGKRKKHLAADSWDFAPTRVAATKSSSKNELEEGDEVDHPMVNFWETGRVRDAVETNQKSTNYGRQPKFGQPLCMILGRTDNNSVIVMPIHSNNNSSKSNTMWNNNHHGESTCANGSRNRETKHGSKKKVTYADEHALFRDKRQQMSFQQNMNLLWNHHPHHSGPVCVDDGMYSTAREDCGPAAALPILSPKNFHFQPMRPSMSSQSVQGPLYAIPWMAHCKYNQTKSTTTTTAKEIQLQKWLSFQESPVAL